MSCLPSLTFMNSTLLSVGYTYLHLITDVYKSTNDPVLRRILVRCLYKLSLLGEYVLQSGKVENSLILKEPQF